MVETFFLAFIVAKLKNYKLKPFFKAKIVYPVLFFAAVYIIFQALIFSGNYTMLLYSTPYKTTYLALFFLAAFWYRRFVPIIIGAACIVIGSIMNTFVMSANGGKMPVFPTLSYITGYAKPGTSIFADNVHVLGNAATKFKILTDVIDLGYCVMSIGDIFIRACAFVIIYSIIKHLNEKGVSAQYQYIMH